MPKFNKKLLYLDANTLYQYFMNVFAYNQMVLTTNLSPSKPKLVEEGNEKWCEIKKKDSDTSIRSNLAVRIQEQKDIVETNNKRIEALKRHAANQAQMIAKKQKQLEEKGIVEQWEGARRPSILAQNLNLLEHIHNCIKYGEADKKRRKIIIKVRTIKHLKDKLEEKYNLYISKQTLSTYLWPKYPNTFVAKRHHHLVLVQIQSMSQNEKSDYPDSHYCLASVKTVERIFKLIETINEPVSIPDHDFPLGKKMKLILSVYFLINPNDTNDSFPDLISIMNSEGYDEVIHIEKKIKPLWVLLVEGGPDENPKHLKNIIEYCKLFHFLDLDYLTVHTHAPGQSSFNPVERGIAPFSSKLAEIVLSIDHYSTHLNSQGKVINEELAKKNFRFLGEKLCDIWQHDQSHGRNVRATYVDTHIDMFDDDDISWQWIEDYCQICRYSLDICKYRNINCCKPSCVPKATTTLLQENNRFLSPMIKGYDQHFLNPIHILEYFDRVKIPPYDKYCLTISEEMHQRLCCSECG
ncbi:13736_t:CDS:2, partial [Gigaspora margarita]